MTLPLSQIKILDFSTLLPGPYASMLMADMGANVLRVNAIGRHDLVKAFQPSIDGSSYAYLTLNRNKKSIGLDLKQQQAIDIVKKLIAEYDVILEQFRPGVMAKFGLDYDSLKKINPKLIYCSITGYGQKGCYKNKAGHDINYLALSGLSSFSGTNDTGPTLSGTQIADIAGGSHHAVMGIMAAIIERTATGNGQHLDISMTDAAFSLTGLFGAGAVELGSKGDPTLGGTVLNGGHFYGYYKTKDDRHISVGSLEPKFAAGFFEAIDKPSWLVRTQTNDADKVKQLNQEIGQVIADKTLEQWTRIFEYLDVCVEPVLTVSQAANSQLMQDRQMIVNVETPSGNKVRQIAPAIKFSNAQNNYSMKEASAESTRAIISALGFSKEHIQSMIENKALE